LALSVLIYKDDIKEISDRWHAPCLNPEPKSALKSPTEIFNLDWEPVNGPHPIDELIEKSQEIQRQYPLRRLMGLKAPKAQRKPIAGEEEDIRLQTATGGMSS